MTLDRDQILAADDLPTDYVTIPRWGGQVRVKAAPVSHHRLTDFINRPTKTGQAPSPEERKIRTFVGTVILCAIDEDGKPLFRWDDADDLRSKHWLSVVKVADKAWELAADEDQAVESIEEGKASSEGDPIFG